MSFVLRALKAVCPPEHTYKVALYEGVVSLEKYGPIGEIKGEGYKAGGNELTGYRVELDSTGEAVLSFNRTEWMNADIKTRSALVYDATTGDRVSIMEFPRTLGVIGGLFELKMPDEGVVRLGALADDQP